MAPSRSLISLAAAVLAVSVYAGSQATGASMPQAVQFDYNDSVMRSQDGVYQVGAGIADATGPVAGVNMMGYASLSQVSTGLQQRCRSRAYIVGNDEARVLFVSVDSAMLDQNIVREVLDRLKGLYGDLYNRQNVVLSGTHSHSGPGGFLQYLIFQITSLGYVKETADALVEGIVRSIVRAHESIRSGRLEVGKTLVMDANRNRSPSAYLNNPPEERAKYQYNVDKDMTLLRMSDLNNNEIGNVNWFAVHCTSLNNTNTLITGDNKGYASYLMESALNSAANPTRLRPNHFPSSDLPRVLKTPVVSAFASTNLGDVTPNTLGAYCLNNPTLECDGICLDDKGRERTQSCHGRGPGFGAKGLRDDRPDAESNRVIGLRQFEGAMSILDAIKAGKKVDIKGDIAYRHEFIDMTKQIIYKNGKEVGRTCLPGLGYSFAAGTTDGPGALNFLQGDNSTIKHPFWKNLLKIATQTPSTELNKCQYPKPVLLATGEFRIPYLWSPELVDTQMLRIGNLVIVAVPGECSTMAGRRLREAVKKVFVEEGMFTEEEGVVVIAGLSNTYSHYITTFEEFQIQRYEGASTLFGPYTLDAYLQQYTKLARAISRNERVPDLLTPPNLIPKAISLLPPVVRDDTPKGVKFGDVETDVKIKGAYRAGLDTAVAKFWAGHPRNDLFQEESYMNVEFFEEATGKWIVVRDDGDWDTRFEWAQISKLSAESIATASWDIPADMTPGLYRIRHFGAHRTLLGKNKRYQGVSSAFNVVAA